MSLIEANTRAYYALTYMLVDSSKINMLYVSKKFYELYHNNGFYKTIMLNGSKYGYMDLIDQFYSHSRYATKTIFKYVKDPHHFPDFTRSVVLNSCNFSYLDLQYTHKNIKYMCIDSENTYYKNRFNWDKIPNIETFIYSGRNINVNGIETCKHLKSVILKKYNTRIDSYTYGSQNLPIEISKIPNLVYLITDADVSNCNIESKKLKTLVCKGIDIKFNSPKIHFCYGISNIILTQGETNGIINYNSLDYRFNKCIYKSLNHAYVDNYLTYKKYTPFIELDD